MDYNTRILIVIETLEEARYYKGYYQKACGYTVSFNTQSRESIKEFIECYGSTDNGPLFLEQLLVLLRLSTSDQDQPIENKELERLRHQNAELLSEKNQSDREQRQFESHISRLEKDLENLQQIQTENVNLKNQLANAKAQNNQYNRYYQNINQYYSFWKRWSQLFPGFNQVDELAKHIASLTEAKEKLERSKQSLEQRFQEMEKELQETHEKLSLATTRLRGVNTHSELGGGGSRSDQLKNEFSHLKMGLFHDLSSKILNNWRDQGSSLSFRSEEFYQIKSILSQRVFGDGMAYFAKDKTEVDTELHLVMDTLESIKDFSPTPAVFREIQEKIQVGLLRSKGVDHSDEALVQYIEETTHGINQDLQKIADLKITDETLSEIRNFVEVSLKLVRDIVNDSNSGELFIPENETIFDDNAHETRGDHKGQIKMTLYAGYRIKGTVLVVTVRGGDEVSAFQPSDLGLKWPEVQRF